jgi:putative phosphoserine phosphatase/1-acylglycerol-3-phosphate O-acyltransferase
MERREVEKVLEAEDVEEKNAGVAAFFDLDGTLMRFPSLEKRFLSMLRYRKLIGVRNYVLWIAEAVRLVPRGINQVMHANKMHLRGVSVGEKDLLKAQSYYPEAIERVAWHVERGHLIAIVSGTLEFLAERAARVLEAELGARGLACTIRICSMRLEEENDRWTGRVVGEAMFGEEKARAIRRIAAAEDLDLQRCFAYGDSASDKWMLDAVGKPAAVNPSNDLGRIARRNDWTILSWGKEKTFMQRASRAEESDRELEAVRAKAGFRA